MAKLRYSALVSTLVLTACAFTAAPMTTPFPTATTVRVLQTTPVPTIERQLHPVPTSLASVTPKPLVFQCQTAIDAPLISYIVTADMGYQQRQVTVKQEVVYVNRTTVELDHLVLNVRANGWPEIFSLESVSVNGDDLSYELTGQRLMIELPGQLEPDCMVRITLSFQLDIPPIDRDGVNAYKGYLGYTDRQINLGHWLPTIAARQSDEWVSHNEIPIGEQDVLEDADWDVTLNIDDAPDGLEVAAPGEILVEEPGFWHYRLVNARDFSLSMSTEFNVISVETENGVKVELYSYDDAILQTAAGEISTPSFALDVAASSLAMYSDLYGDYPYQRMVVVQSDFPDGMEFSGLVFVGGEYFRGFNGPTSYLLLITIHEIAHQWWYARVGNDQAINPWLDEALATYSEYAYIEEYYPALRDWWWSFRVDAYAPDGDVDSTVYEFDTRREYINAVYLRGVHMLQDLRATLGTDTFFDWLRQYAEVGAGRIVDPTLFWSLLTPEQFAATAPIREKYLRQPHIVVFSSNP